MLVIRLFRIGKKNQPSFKIVVTDKRNAPRGGRFTEQVGFYNPLTKEKNLKKERIQYWISRGAKPSPTISNLLIREGISEGRKIAVHKKSKKTVAAAPTVEAPKQVASEAAPLPAVVSAEAGAPAEAPKQ